MGGCVETKKDRRCEVRHQEAAEADQANGHARQRAGHADLVRPDQRRARRSRSGNTSRRRTTSGRPTGTTSPTAPTLGCPPRSRASPTTRRNKFKVRAVNSVGDGAESDESSPVTPRAQALTRNQRRAQHCDPDPRPPLRQLVPEAHSACGHNLQGQGNDDHREPDGPGWQHQLHLQGIQRQRLLDGARGTQLS